MKNTTVGGFISGDITSDYFSQMVSVWRIYACIEAARSKDTSFGNKCNS